MEKSNELSCKNCAYCWKDDDDDYPRCHYNSLGSWDPAPCEQPENDPEGEPDYDEERW